MKPQPAPLSTFAVRLALQALAGASLLLSSASAWAHITVGVHMGVPSPVYPALPRAYVAPPMVYVVPRVVVPVLPGVMPLLPYWLAPVPYARPALPPSHAPRHGGWQAPRHHGGAVHGGHGRGYGGHRHR